MGMLSTLENDPNVENPKLIARSDAGKDKKQPNAKDTIKKVSFAPRRQGSTSLDGDLPETEDQFPDQELESDNPASQPAPTDNTPHNPEQFLHGFGAQLTTAGDPRDDADLLGNDLENMGPGGM